MGESQQTRRLNDDDVEILRECAGQSAPRPWGAAVGAVLESLRGFGLVDRAGFITQAGRDALAQIDEGRA